MLPAYRSAPGHPIHANRSVYPMHTRLTLFSIVVIVAALAALVPTLQLPGSADVSTFIGPQLWPLILLIALLAFSSWLLLDSRKRTHQTCATTDEAPSAASHSLSLAANRHWLMMAMTIAYTVLMQMIGFLLATVIFAVAISWLLGARHWGLIIATAVIAVVLIQGVFVFLLGIPLP